MGWWRVQRLAELEVGAEGLLGNGTAERERVGRSYWVEV